jgi:hypothetical protein
MTEPTGWVCRSCGKRHDEAPLSYAIDAPVYWTGEEANRQDCVLDQEYCIIRGEHFFIRGNVDIPVVDSGDTFQWTVWVSLSGPNMQRTFDLWETAGRESEPPYFGWFATDLPLYEPTTVELKANVHTQPVGTRPRIKLEPTGHPLAVEQRDGITTARVQEIAERLLHG